MGSNCLFQIFLAMCLLCIPEFSSIFHERKIRAKVAAPAYAVRFDRPNHAIHLHDMQPVQLQHQNFGFNKDSFDAVTRDRYLKRDKGGDILHADMCQIA